MARICDLRDLSSLAIAEAATRVHVAINIGRGSEASLRSFLDECPGSGLAPLVTGELNRRAALEENDEPCSCRLYTKPGSAAEPHEAGAPGCVYRTAFELPEEA